MTIRSQFESRCKRCGGRIAVGTEVEWVRGVKGVTHTDKKLCAAELAAKASRPVVTTGSHKPLADFLRAARARGLKFPKARFLAPVGVLNVEGQQATELRLSLAGERSKAPGSVNVMLDDGWIGRIEPNGTVIGKLAFIPAVLDLLTEIAKDPAHAAKEYGALMARCSFCNLPLTDEGSVEVGYGPTCAKHWGLPHKAKGTLVLEEVPVPKATKPVVEASELGLTGWPSSLVYQGRGYVRGPAAKDAEGEVVSVTYTNAEDELVVLND